MGDTAEHQPLLDMSVEAGLPTSPYYFPHQSLDQLSSFINIKQEPTEYVDRPSPELVESSIKCESDLTTKSPPEDDDYPFLKSEFNETYRNFATMPVAEKEANPQYIVINYFNKNPHVPVQPRRHPPKSNNVKEKSNHGSSKKSATKSSEKAAKTNMKANQNTKQTKTATNVSDSQCGTIPKQASNVVVAKTYTITAKEEKSPMEYSGSMTVEAKSEMIADANEKISKAPSKSRKGKRKETMEVDASDKAVKDPPTKSKKRKSDSVPGQQDKEKVFSKKPKLQTKPKKSESQTKSGIRKGASKKEATVKIKKETVAKEESEEDIEDIGMDDLDDDDDDDNDLDYNDGSQEASVEPIDIYDSMTEEERRIAKNKKRASNLGHKSQHKNIGAGKADYLADSELWRVLKESGRSLLRVYNPVTKKAICRLCDKEFFKRPTAYLHEWTHIPREKWPMKCSYCPATFVAPRHKKKHEITKHTLDFPFKCDVCGWGYVDQRLLKRHQRSHSQSKPHLCDNCGKSFYHDIVFKTHLYEVHGISYGDFQCENCSRKFTTYAAKLSHTRAGTCEKADPADPDVGAKVRKPRHPPKQCEGCGKLSISKAAQYKHKLKCPHINRDVYECTLCKKSYSTPRRLQIHQQFHFPNTETSEVQCRKCLQAFLNEDDYFAHETTTCIAQPEPNKVRRRSQNYTAVACPQCNKVFTRGPSMRRHVRTVHEKIKKFACPVCDKCFGTSASRLVHQRNVHGRALSLECFYCKASFKDRQQLEEHVDSFHANQIAFPCVICNINFSAEAELKEHINFVHL